MYPAASAAYMAMSAPTPPLQLPAGYTSVGLIQADPTKAAAAMAQAHPDQQRIANVTVAESSIFGLVAWNAAALSTIVALRGTQTVWDWVDDFDVAPVPYMPVHL